MNIRIVILPFLFSAILLQSCRDISSCKSDLFSQVELNEIKDSLFFFSRTSYIKNGLTYCGYEIRLKYWESYPLVSLFNPQYVIKGDLLERQDSIFFKNTGEEDVAYFFSIENHKNVSRFIDLNFDLIKYDAEKANEESIKQKKRLKYFIQDIFFSEKYNSIIYKIRIYEYPYFSVSASGNDLVLFLSTDCGIIGAYLSYSEAKNKEIDIIFSHTGNIFSSRYDSCCIDFEMNGGFE